jgi:transposase
MVHVHGVQVQGLVELNPVHVTAQRRVNGQRDVKTDPVDLAAIGDLLVAGRGIQPALATQRWWSWLGWSRTATVGCRSDRHQEPAPRPGRPLLSRAVGLLVKPAGDQDRAAGAGRVSRPGQPGPPGTGPVAGRAARRGVMVQRKVAERLVAAARVAPPTDQASVARRVLADDLAPLTQLDTQIGVVTQQLAALVATTLLPSSRACPAGQPAGRRLCGCGR